MYRQFNIQQFYVLPTHCIYVFCVDLRTNSDFSPYNINPLMPKDAYIGRTAPLTSKRCILYIYSTNTGTEYF